MPSRLQIVNTTLRKIGQKKVTGVTATKAARLVNEQMKDSLDQVLSAHPWDELKDYASLVATNWAEGLYPKTINVDKAGNPSFNIDMLFVGLDDLEYPIYSLSGEATGIQTLFNGTNWDMTDGVDVYYTNPSTEKEPPKIGWVLAIGSNPPPEITYNDPVVPEFTYSHSFVRPFNFARLVEEEPKGYMYDNVKGYVYTEDRVFDLSYVGLPTAAVLTEDWQNLPYDDVAFDNLELSGTLVDILGYHILSRCSYGITGDHNDTQIYEGLYSKFLAKATNVQAQQQRDQFMEVSENTSWEASRL
jgi:hypothetical protein